MGPGDCVLYTCTHYNLIPRPSHVHGRSGYEANSNAQLDYFLDPLIMITYLQVLAFTITCTSIVWLLGFFL